MAKSTRKFGLRRRAEEAVETPPAETSSSAKTPETTATLTEDVPAAVTTPEPMAEPAVEPMAESTAAPIEPVAAPLAPPSMTPPLLYKEAKAVARYANFCRVIATPEEMIIDFALNEHPLEINGDAVLVSQRVVVNHFTAKRLIGALLTTVQRHEATFGVLETDLQRRLASRAAAPRS